VWTLAPNTPFQPLETCTVTVYAARVADQDLDDPADAMVADHEFSFSVAEVLLAEDFEAGSPAGWTVFDQDGRTPAGVVAYVSEAWVVRDDFNFYSSNHAAFSTSWYVPPGAADDWLMTPALALPTGRDCLLEWQAVAYDPAYPDGYEVRVSTTDASPAGALANSALLVVPREAFAWTPHSVGLLPYAGSTIYLAFRNVSDDRFLLLIDHVRVTCIL
jgi:hypothetical protein